MNVAWAMFWAGSRSMKPCVFPCHKVSLHVAKKGTSSVRRVWLGSFHARIVPPTCFATIGCSCVHSSMWFLKLLLQIALAWLYECCMGYIWGGNRSTKTCVFRVKWL